MNTARLARLAPLSGVAFLVFALAGVLTMGESPDFPGTPAEWASYFADDEQAIIMGAWIFSYGLFFLLWFLGSLASVARRAEGGDGRVSRLAYGGGVAGATLMLAGNGAIFMAGLRVDEAGTISDDVATVYGDLFSALAFLAAPVAFAVLVGGLTVISTRTPFLPTWLTWVSGLLAVALLIPFISWAAVCVFALWCAVVGTWLYVKAAPDQA